MAFKSKKSLQLIHLYQSSELIYVKNHTIPAKYFQL